MAEDFEKNTKLILGSDESSYGKSVIGLAIGIDRVFGEIKEETTRNHEAVMKAIAVNKVHIDNQCKLCQDDVKQKLDLLKIWFALAENPKLRKAFFIMGTIILVLATIGGRDLILSSVKAVASIFKILPT